MLAALLVLLACQLAGETAAFLGGLPVPGPVLGMALLVLILAVRGGPGKDLRETASGLLAHLSLLFVPAGVGVMVHGPRLQAEWPAILAALLISTPLTIAVTALVMHRLTRTPGTER